MRIPRTVVGCLILTAVAACDRAPLDRANDVSADPGTAALSQPITDTPASAGAAADGKSCTLGADCSNLVCADGTVTTPSPHGKPINCPSGETCTCQAPTDIDGVQNDSETGIDCGGGFLATGSTNPKSDGAPACANGKSCLLGTDCSNLVCADGTVTTPSPHGKPINCPSGETCTCQAPTDIDGVQNDSETGIDCGGRFLATGSANPRSDGAPACANGKSCLLGTDCVNLVCADGTVTTPSTGGKPINCPAGQTCTCQAPTDIDGVRNDSETGVDCGGGFLASGSANPKSDGAPACANGKSCLLGTDCVNLVCADGTVTTPSTDGKPINCPAGQTCTCQAPTDIDGVRNDSETGVDCGGGFLATGSVNPKSDGAPACANGKSCLLGTDCVNLVCADGTVTTPSPHGKPINCAAGTTCTCQAPTDADGVQNDSETDVDCGGALLANGKPNSSSDGAPACSDGKRCVLGTDCVNLVCSDGSVTTPSPEGKPINCPAGQTCTCQAPTDIDGVQNDSETGIDCGGGFQANGSANPKSDGAPACADGESCLVGADCVNLVCADGTVTTPSSDGQPISCPAGQICTCQAPTDIDGVQNDSETDIDCGGALLADGEANTASDGAPACATGKACVLGTDCVNLVCANDAAGAAPSTDGQPIDCPAGTTCTCQAANDVDGVQNDSETDIDCGGAQLADGGVNPASDGAPACPDNSTCVLSSDCLSLLCVKGVCQSSTG